MFTRLLFLFLTILFGLYIYISSLNPLQVKFQFYPKSFINTSLSILVMASFFFGGLIVFLIYFLKDMKRAFRERKAQKLQHFLWIRFQKGTEALFRGDLKKAERYFWEYLERKGDDLAVCLRLAEVYHREGKDDAAMEVLRKARSTSGDGLEVLFQEAHLYREKGDLEGAKRALEEVLRIDPSNLEALKALRDIEMERKRWDEALKLQKRVLKASSADGEGRALLMGLRYEKAKALAQGERVQEARKELKEIFKEDPSFVPAQVLWGELLQREGKGKEAVRVWKRGWERTGRIIFLEKLESHFLSEGDPRGIVHIYLKALEASPKNLALPFFYARLCLRLEMVDEALEKMKELEGLLSHHPAYHFLLAEIHQHRGETEEAARAYRRGLELEGRDVVNYRCKICGREERGWVDFCQGCKRWGTYYVCAVEGPEETGVSFPFQKLL